MGKLSVEQRNKIFGALFLDLPENICYFDSLFISLQLKRGEIRFMDALRGIRSLFLASLSKRNQ